MVQKMSKTISSEQQRKTLMEEAWLKYYNQLLFEKGIITERERNQMIHKIDFRTSRNLSR